MPKQWLNLAAITEAAIEVVETGGFEALGLSTVAQQLGIGPSALYAHVDGLEGLRYLVATTATNNLTEEVRNAAIGTAGDRALTAIGTAYRRFATDHPGQFASTLLPPRGNDDDLTAANQALDDVFVLVHAAMGRSADDSRLAARSTRSAIHGFLALEHNAGADRSHEAEFEHLLSTLQHGLAATRPRAGDSSPT